MLTEKEPEIFRLFFLHSNLLLLCSVFLVTPLLISMSRSGLFYFPVAVILICGTFNFFDHVNSEGIAALNF